MEFRILLPDVRMRWMHRQGQVERDSNGRALRVSGVTFDITERREVEEALELVTRFPAENPAPVMRLNEGRVVSFANPAAERLLALWGPRLGDDAPSEMVDVARTALSEGAKRNIDLSFDDRTYSVTFAPVRTANYVNLYFSDITDRKHLEREREDLLRKLTRSQEELLSKVGDLELFHDIAVERELKMMELEREVHRLKAMLAKS